MCLGNVDDELLNNDGDASRTLTGPYSAPPVTCGWERLPLRRIDKRPRALCPSQQLSVHQHPAPSIEPSLFERYVFIVSRNEKHLKFLFCLLRSLLFALTRSPTETQLLDLIALHILAAHSRTPVHPLSTHPPYKYGLINVSSLSRHPHLTSFSLVHE